MSDKRVIAIIPARGGSKGVVHKNIRLLGNKPLLAWTIDVVKKVEKIDRVIVSTDCDAIADVAKSYGAEVNMRPADLATDKALVIDVVKHLVGILRTQGENADIFLLLEPPAPFRAECDVNETLSLLLDNDYDSVATFSEAPLNPYRAWSLKGDKPQLIIPNANPWKPRQCLPSAYKLNGAVYAFRYSRMPQNSPAMLFGRCGAVIMPNERSVDIDTELDFKLAELIVGEMNGR